MLFNRTLGSGENQIIFIHGNSQSSKVWVELMNQPSLVNKYSLMAIDLPGHGESFRSSDPEIDYSLKGLARQTLQFLETEIKSSYILVGNSLASNIIGEIASQLKNCKGIMITGSCLLGMGLTLEDVFLPNPNSGVSFTEKPTEEQIDLLVGDVVYNSSTDVKSLIKHEYLNTDGLVRSNLANTIATQDYSDQLQNIKDSKIPTAFVFGEQEKVCNVNYLNALDIPKWKNKAILIEDSGHFSHLDQPQELAEIIADFADNCFK